MHLVLGQAIFPCKVRSDFLKGATVRPIKMFQRLRKKWVFERKKKQNLPLFYLFGSFFSFSPNQAPWPSWSSSCHVRLSVCLSVCVCVVLRHCVQFFQAAHWSPGHMINSRPVISPYLIGKSPCTTCRSTFEFWSIIVCPY